MRSSRASAFRGPSGTAPTRAVSVSTREGVFRGDAGERNYLLQGPDAPVRPAALVVMLHGARQDPHEFARTTRMAERAAGDGTFVLFPEQGADHPARCWNWFRSSDQFRGRGEPAVIAAMTRQIAADLGIPPRRVYVAGLSAGAAMAVVVGHAYPEIYAAVGAHSGVAYRAASTMYEAFDVMARGPGDDRAPNPASAVPTIVFHGDSDSTVHMRNANAIIDDALHALPPLRNVTRTVEAGPGVRRHTTTAYVDGRGRSIAEAWIVHGGEHAWYGGARDGRYTDPEGPDATVEMLRFFRTHTLEPRCAT